MAAAEEWDQDRPLTSQSIMHEIVDDTYRMTVSQSKTGELQFSWRMAIGDAVEFAHTILRLVQGESNG